MRLQTVLVLIAACLIPGHAIAQDREEEEGYSREIEVGPAFDRDFKRRATNFGASLGFEATVIEHWLELEASVSRLTAPGRSEQGFEFLLKKPFQLSQNTDLMVGLGPEITRTTNNGLRDTVRTVQFVLDFQFWQSRSFGWYVEPGYSAGIGNSRGERSFGASVGLLFRWP